VGRTCVVSTHFDDAVLSSASLIAAASSVVVTVFSEGPTTPGKISDWDRACGFLLGDDVMAARAAEDAAALTMLGATPASLGFSEYRSAIPLWSRALIARGFRFARDRRGSVELTRRITEDLADRVRQLDVATCAFPLGIYHYDHRLTTLACLNVARQRPDIRWLVYEDMPYAIESRQRRMFALRRIRAAGFSLEQLMIDEQLDAVRKREAVACYASQLRGLHGRYELALTSPERYHLLTPKAATATQ
jgi:LmbE family N-acetylglucosaminyl deacetylase